MSKALTHEEVEERLRLDGRGFFMRERYINTNTKILFGCSEGHDWEARPDCILRGSGCPHCSSTAKKTPEEYRAELKQDGRGYEAVEDYVNSKTPIMLRCPEGHEWKVKPRHIIRGRGCPHCSRKAKKTPEQYGDDLKQSGRGYVAVENYVNRDTPIIHRCSEGHEWSAKPSHILFGKGCPGCASYGFDPSKPAMLYVILHRLRDGRERVNIGITNRRLEDRYSKADRSTMREVWTYEQDDGQAIADLERALHQHFSFALDTAGLGLDNKVGAQECFAVSWSEAVFTAKQFINKPQNKAQLGLFDELAVDYAQTG